MGSRVDRLTMRTQPAPRGEFVYEPCVYEWYGKRPMVARLLELGTTRELLPHLEHARIVRVRRGLLVAGDEVIARASKSKGERFRQTWLCSVERIPPDAWPAPPRNPSARGFDIADDDAVD